MIRPTLRYTLTDTLFPYTTVFRSRRDHQLHHHPRAGVAGGVTAVRRVAQAGAALEILDLLPVAAHQQHVADGDLLAARGRSEEHTSELQSLMRISYAVFCLKKKKNT